MLWPMVSVSDLLHVCMHTFGFLTAQLCLMLWHRKHFFFSTLQLIAALCEMLWWVVVVDKSGCRNFPGGNKLGFSRVGYS